MTPSQPCRCLILVIVAFVSITFFLPMNPINHDLETAHPPSVSFAESEDETRSDYKEAGVLTHTFNGYGLSAGDHILIVQRTPAVVTVRQPVGADTSLTVGVPEGWLAGEPVAVRAFDRQGRILGEADASIDERQVTFTYRQRWNGRQVGYYELGTSLKVYLPAVRLRP